MIRDKKDGNCASIASPKIRSAKSARNRFS